MAIENEKLQNKFKKATNSLATLEKALEDIKDVSTLARCAQQDPEAIYKTYRDAMIQRFEYTFDTTWKYLSEYLQTEGRILTIKTPKTVFREALKAKILSAPEVRVAIKMVDHRNLTTHGYDEELIEEISKKFPAYAELLKTILQRTKI